MFLNKEITWMRGLLKKALSIRGKLFLYFLIILVPFMTYPFQINGNTIHLRKIREICFYSFAIIACSYLQKSRWLRYFIIWCATNWWLNFFMPKESFVILTNILSALIIYIGVKQLLKIGFIKGNTLLKIICFTVLFQCVWLIMQMFNFDPLFYPVTASGNPYKIRMPLCGLSGNPSLLGIFFACFSFLFLEYFKIKKFPVFFFIILGFGLFLKNATTAMAFTIGSVFYLLSRYLAKGKYVLIGILIFLLLGSFLIFVKNPNLDRLPIWQKLITDGIKVRPFVGSGLGVFSHLVIIDRGGTPWYEAHNDYLQMILELGLIGFILFSGFIISRVMMFFKSERNNKQVCIMSCLVAYLVSGISLFPMHLTQMSFYAVILLAVLENSYNEIKVLQS